MTLACGFLVMLGSRELSAWLLSGTAVLQEDGTKKSGWGGGLVFVVSFVDDWFRELGKAAQA